MPCAMRTWLRSVCLLDLESMSWYSTRPTTLHSTAKTLLQRPPCLTQIFNTRTRPPFILTAIRHSFKGIKGISQSANIRTHALKLSSAPLNTTKTCPKRTQKHSFKYRRLYQSFNVVFNTDTARASASISSVPSSLVCFLRNKFFFY